MNNSQKYFLELISSQINETEVMVSDNQIDWYEIYNLAKIHSLGSIVFSAMNKLQDKVDIPLEIYNNMKKKLLFQMKYNMIFDENTDNLIEVFNQEKIKHIVIKGYILKKYYPSREYRSMSDIDIFIDLSDREKVYKIMKRLGYENERQCDDVWTYKKKFSYIEVHTTLVEQEIKQDIDFKKYFSNLWEYTIALKGNYCYTLNKNYHLIYLLVHIAKHFYGCGCGVRMIMDIAVYINKFGEELDWNYIWTEMDKLDLRLLTQNILILCNKWFDTKLDFEYEIEDEFYDKLSETILNGGTFGFYNSNFRIAQIRNDIAKTNKKGNTIKTKVLKQMLFPSYEELINQSSIHF
ncbi:nucleotidyltransferase domain-containing protein [Intestinibacter sp.]|uniref:nucleotidyltransferase domain-containing protein n=1 Tax=Intestinibacter sp. TaxID=1965304 RepID=UPI002A9100EF|nr:nucleotidyltransferase family protein [Intestinibacter sp.]MDY5212289.1 nucleotidyltransferase family protein [Intestinibacter sp.]